MHCPQCIAFIFIPKHMKLINRSSWLAVWLLAMLTAGAQQTPSLLQFKTAGELQQFLSYSKDRVPLISAHRGGPAKGYPENALETFQHSILSEPLVIECDIALSKDSALVLMHDNQLDRTSTGKGPIGNYTYEELKAFRLKDNEGDTTAFTIPTLDEILLWGKDKVIYTLDVKRGVPYAKIIEAVRRCKAETCSVIITYSADQAAEVYRLAPDLMMSVSVQSKEDLDRLNSKGIPDNRLVAFVGTRGADDSLYALLHERKIQCILGTMGNLDKQAIAKGDNTYYSLVDKGADILSTDRPREAGLILQQYRKDHHLQSKHIKLSSSGSIAYGQQDTLQHIAPNRRNSAEGQKKPYVILISADGFRYDYAVKYHAAHLLAFAQQGVQAVSMKPSYPSVTFPNHYTLVTGLYPSHHGLVNNTFYDPEKQASYSMGDKDKVRDGSWYGGTPLWVLVEQQQMLSASMFWVGSEADVKNTRPAYYYNYNERIPVDRRIEIVKEWLTLPEDMRPHLITFYLSEPDHAGHRFGPDAPETEQAVQSVDSVIYHLTEAVKSTGLPVSFIFLADHGMTAVDREHPLPLPAAIDKEKFIIPASGTMVVLHAKNKADIQPLYETLKKEEDHYKVYLKSNMPPELHYSATDDKRNRIGDILLLPEWPYVFSDRKPGAGYHGFDPNVVKDMHATFMAWGPAFKQHLTIPTFENVNVYPMIAEILGLKITDPIDGRKEVLHGILR